MAISIDQVTRIFVMLESINFAKMRNEFESAATFEKIAAGENALDVALKIVGQFVPPIEIAPNDLEILMPVLGVIAQVAVSGAPFPIPRSEPRHYDQVAGQVLDSTFGSIDGFELAGQIRDNRPKIDVILTSGVTSTSKAGDLCDDGPVEKPCHSRRAAARQQVVLVVEDEILVRLTIADYLRDAGYAVVEAATAIEALEVFASDEPVDVIFTDVQMPGAMDGLMLVRWVHEHHPGTQVLVTSGKGDAALSAGLIPYDAFFSKPYPIEEVANRIRSLIGPNKTGQT